MDIADIDHNSIFRDHSLDPGLINATDLKSETTKGAERGLGRVTLNSSSTSPIGSEFTNCAPCGGLVL